MNLPGVIEFWRELLSGPNVRYLPLLGLGALVLVLVLLSTAEGNFKLSGIKSQTVGDGQYGTARWATEAEIRAAYHRVPFQVSQWRQGKNLPKQQGLVLGSQGKGKRLSALVDADDVHCLMIGASGVGKTAFFLYPNLENACACGMSFLALDTKGDLRLVTGPSLGSPRVGKKVKV